MVASMRSPGSSHFGGDIAAATPAGLPDVITSPGSSVMFDHHATRSRIL